MVKMKDEFALNQALELTKLAVQANMIRRGDNSKDAANSVLSFFNILFTGFTKENDEWFYVLTKLLMIG